MYIGIDLGTSSVKLMVMDVDGQIKYETTRDYLVDYPKPLWAEQNPEDWWINTLDGLKELFENVNKKEVKAISFSGQMHGLVTLDKQNNILYPAMLWCDQRTGEHCDEITNFFGPEKLSEYVGNKALTGFTAPKILWLKEYKPEVFNAINMMLLPKDYIRFRLSGDFASDYSDASGMLLLNVKNKCYSSEMLEMIGITTKQLPKLYESYEVTGKLSDAIKAELGISHDVLIIAGAGDQAAGAIGSGVVKPGAVSITLGTSGVVFAAHDDYKVDKENRLHAFCHASGGYHSMGVMISAASCLKWWNDEAQSNEDIGKLLLEVDDAITDVIFLPYLLGERTPYANPDAKGVFFGMTMTTDRGALTKAVLEGVAFGLKDSFDLLKEMNIKTEDLRIFGGGAQSQLWKQIIADIFGQSVYDINTNQGGALGAAILAAVGAGAFSDVSEATDHIIKTTTVYEPDMVKYESYKIKHNKFTELYKRLEPLF